MGKDVKDPELLVVKEKGSDELKVVSSVDDKGNVKVVPPQKENEPDFLKLDKHGNVLENFLSNLSRQYKDPTHFQFFKIPKDFLEKMKTLFSKPETANKLAEAKKYEIDVTKPVKKEFQKVDESKINWKELEKLGVSKDTLERLKYLDAMLNWQKTPGLVPIVINIGEATIRTDARLAFRQDAEGNINTAVHAIRKEPDLNRPFYGTTLTEEDKTNLRQTGNAGRVVEIQPKNGDKLETFVSLDKLTNEILAVDKNRIKIPAEISGVKLSEEQKATLAQGKPLYVEGLISKNGKEFNATLQVDADRKGIGYSFDNNKQGQEQTTNKQQTINQQPNEIKIPNKLLGVQLSDQQKDNLKTGVTIYIAGMTDREGKEFNAYVKINEEKGKLDFFKYNPDKSKSKEVTPDNASKTQVAVNSEGKTNEATKKVKEPLTKGQTNPTEKQKEKQEQKKEKTEKKQAPKAKGRKM